MDIYDEHTFWLGILMDHLVFIKEATPLDQVVHHQRIASLQEHGKDVINLLEDQEDSIEISLIALNFAEQVGILKREFLQHKLTKLFELEMDPTTLNHMLNELEEYITIINEFLIDGVVTPKHVLHHHKLWLNDAHGHLVIIKKQLDPIEKELKERVSDEKDEFHHLFMKSLELIGYLRATDVFPELLEFNKKAFRETQSYLILLSDLADLLENNLALGSLKTRYLDHFMREQSYYLIKLGVTSQENPLPLPMVNF